MVLIDPVPKDLVLGIGIPRAPAIETLRIYFLQASLEFLHVTSGCVENDDVDVLFMVKCISTGISASRLRTTIAHGR
jgi:hypothetical protein